MSVPAPNPYEMLLLLGSTAKCALLHLCSCQRLATSRSAVVQVECSEPFLRTLLSLLSLMHTLPTRCPRGTGVFPTGASLHSTASLEPRRVVLFSTVCSAAPEAAAHPPERSRCAARQGWSGSIGPGRVSLCRVAEPCRPLTTFCPS